MKILLLGTYELGRQPFGLASPAAWLRKRGHVVHCADLSREALDEAALREARLVAFYLPMHTATRLALQWAKAIRAQNPSALLCACGLYAPLNEALLHQEGFAFVLGPEFEADLAELADSLSAGRPASSINSTNSTNAEASVINKIPRLAFQTPDRRGLPPLRKYAHVVLPDGSPRTAGYTEASRGCKHLCRHCPIVPVYAGQFRVVPVEIVLADIRQQVAAGAQHITFGDPDFFNGITHATRVVEALHSEFPRLTYDATIKIEHLLHHAGALETLQRTGCLFITSAVESLDDDVLHKLAKGHTCADFFRALELCTCAGLVLHPTFVPFTPWTTRESYLQLIDTLAGRDLIAAVPPIQLAIRLLIPARSRLLELPEIVSIVGEFDSEKLVYPWTHRDPVLDLLSERLVGVIAEGEKKRQSRSDTFAQIWSVALDLLGSRKAVSRQRVPPHAVPFLSEPWYC